MLNRKPEIWGAACYYMYVILINIDIKQENIMNEKIIIVDDEKEIADLVELYLKNDGYNV